MRWQALTRSRRAPLGLCCSIVGSLWGAAFALLSGSLGGRLLLARALVVNLQGTPDVIRRRAQEVMRYIGCRIDSWSPLWATWGVVLGSLLAVLGLVLGSLGASLRSSWAPSAQVCCSIALASSRALSPGVYLVSLQPRRLSPRRRPSCSPALSAVASLDAWARCQLARGPWRD